MTSIRIMRHKTISVELPYLFFSSLTVWQRLAVHFLLITDVERATDTIF